MNFETVFFHNTSTVCIKYTHQNEVGKGIFVFNINKTQDRYFFVILLLSQHFENVSQVENSIIPFTLLGKDAVLCAGTQISVIIQPVTSTKITF